MFIRDHADVHAAARPEVKEPSAATDDELPTRWEQDVTTLGAKLKECNEENKQVRSSFAFVLRISQVFM